MMETFVVFGNITPPETLDENHISELLLFIFLFAIIFVVYCNYFCCILFVSSLVEFSKSRDDGE
jgi:hypothetical protein